ncbi:DUF4437 domain-containing protein [Pseudoalteromonas rubra]|uniref:DUF4437 domain-containing protein n=1 Tax=Pseudoalteromonas rubra TaxID=43658 RepID=UPI00143135C5|nr:DUF4437 domain-containing protein [Pseudoalteromonas rubra]
MSFSHETYLRGKIQFTQCFNYFGVFFLPLSKAQDTSLGSNEVTIISTEQIEWGHLNPAWVIRARGLRTCGETEMLVRFEPGFSSPPHIHNVSYRGIVIEGPLHNDDPQAKAMWMPPDLTGLKRLRKITLHPPMCRAI